MRIEWSPISLLSPVWILKLESELAQIMNFEDTNLKFGEVNGIRSKNPNLIPWNLFSEESWNSCKVLWEVLEYHIIYYWHIEMISQYISFSDFTLSAVLYIDFFQEDVLMWRVLKQMMILVIPSSLKPCSNTMTAIRTNTIMKLERRDPKSHIRPVTRIVRPKSCILHRFYRHGIRE